MKTHGACNAPSRPRCIPQFSSFQWIHLTFEEYLALQVSVSEKSVGNEMPVKKYSHRDATIQLKQFALIQASLVGGSSPPLRSNILINTELTVILPGETRRTSAIGKQTRICTHERGTDERIFAKPESEFSFALPQLTSSPSPPLPSPTHTDSVGEVLNLKYLISSDFRVRTPRRSRVLCHILGVLRDGVANSGTTSVVLYVERRARLSTRERDRLRRASVIRYARGMLVKIEKDRPSVHSGRDF